LLQALSLLPQALLLLLQATLFRQRLLLQQGPLLCWPKLHLQEAVRVTTCPG
jgi:hypothetical protein